MLNIVYVELTILDIVEAYPKSEKDNCQAKI